ncbi:MAG: hypothetical protein LBM93_02165 [Oscillospiraceae bacterium]|jgi:dihydrofolate synthase/folylpolyglutamate synthase|nr:hypothetical protein [Oscillospiraceae bacterium]
MTLNDFTKYGEPVKNLSRIKDLLNELGNPQDSLKFVHIAGTNGKGSVLEFSSQALINAGYKVGQFTSPFNIVFEDRIRINGKHISPENFSRLFESLEPAIKHFKYSQFEIIFAVALLYFKEQECDLVFLETGIGGVLDCTNVVENKLVTAFTSISKDHMEILGKTIREIARQKSGIIRKGVPVVISEQQYEEAGEIIRDIALEKDCKVWDSNVSLPILTSFKLRMAASYQNMNSKVALQVIHCLIEQGYNVTFEHIKKSFEKIQLPSRLETFSSDPWIIIDGAHNLDGMLKLSAEFKTKEKYKEFTVIFGVQKTKEYGAMCELLQVFAKNIIIVDDFYDFACKYKTLKECFTIGTIHKKASESLDYALEINNKVLICGSLYLRAAVLHSS